MCRLFSHGVITAIQDHAAWFHTCWPPHAAPRLVAAPPSPPRPSSTPSLTSTCSEPTPTPPNPCIKPPELLTGRAGASSRSLGCWWCSLLGMAPSPRPPAAAPPPLPPPSRAPPAPAAALAWYLITVYQIPPACGAQMCGHLRLDHWAGGQAAACLWALPATLRSLATTN